MRVNLGFMNSEIEKAPDFLCEMISKGHDPHVVTYKTLLDGLCKNSEIEKAMNFLHDMKFKGLEPNVMTYYTLIDGICKKSQIDKP